MYNVLHILTGCDGGITAVVKNYYSHIDRNKIHFDIACITDQEGNDVAALRSMGAEIFHLPMKVYGIKAYTQGLKKLLTQKKYDAIHVHENETSYVALKVAKQMGVKKRFAHSHSSAPYTSLKGEVRRLSGVVLNYHYATRVIGCGQFSGERIFGKHHMKSKKALVLCNAVDSEKFAYDAADRARVRNELKLSDKFVVGLVGRLSEEKNHLYALSVIKKAHEVSPNLFLVLVGDGDEETAIRAYIEEHQMSDYVAMLGKRTDVASLYRAFDVFMLPSLQEAFPLVVVEAMASGLPVLLASNITKEFSFGQAVRYIDLGKDDEWVNALCDFSKDDKRQMRLDEIKNHMLDIRQSAKKLEELYLE